MILVTGAGGLLGQSVVNHAILARRPVTGLYRLSGTDRPGCKAIIADLSVSGAGEALVAELRPKLIVHCAAMTSVDWCEQHPAEAFATNVAASRELAAAANRANAQFVYISTDSVFDGERGNYVETDLPAPVNVYARTKLLGEQAVRESNPDALVLRTNFFGQRSHGSGASLAEWLLTQFKSGNAFPAFRDVTFNPLFVDDLVAILMRLADCDITGILHLGASDECSKLEFAQMMAHEFGYDAHQILSRSIENVELRAPRPKNTTLATATAQRILEQKLPTVAASVRQFRAASTHTLSLRP